MECLRCRKKKLSKEFPPFTLNEECEHAPLHCLRCVTSYVETNGNRCSKCNKEVDENLLCLCYIQLDALFPEVRTSTRNESILSNTKSANSKNGPDYITVKRFDGMTLEIEYDKSVSLNQIKRVIHRDMDVRVEKQCLLFLGKELKETRADKPILLTELGVKAGDTIHLMILLYAIPPNLTKVVFDLSFGWPDKGKDYLDASALIFSKRKYEGAADLRTLGFPPLIKKEAQAIYHSGDRQDKVRKQGKHLIKVNLSLVPKQITHVFFTLSSYKAPDISLFKNPTLRFFDESKPQKELFPDLIKKAGTNQAIVMCSLVKMNDQWFVHDNGTISRGNVEDYEPLKRTIIGIIDSTS